MKRLTKKERVIKKLNMTLKKLRKLKDSKFKYQYFVSKWDSANKCGTVCCVAGWYPQWFPEAGLIWKWDGNEQCLELSSKSRQDVWDQLCKYHEVNDVVIDALFYGNIILMKNSSTFITAEHGTDSNKEEVIELFETVIEAIENDTIDWR